MHISCKNRIASLCPMQDTACLGLVHRYDPEGCYGEGGGRGFMFGNTCTPVLDSCQCMAKPIQYCKVKQSKNKNLKTNKQKRIVKISECLVP